MSEDVITREGYEEDQHPGHVAEKYENWFLEYASYVILERAVPAVADGLKPVQRRIMHALKEMDDGRYNKVANVIGQTMQYHPHGDASIGDAMIHIGQKDLLLDTQGNWGDFRTGDGAAAARYIEVRLSKFALEVAFNSKTTDWQLSYDGRKREPITLPMKFPLLLAQGAEGIAVGLSTKILPHNFIELIEASIKFLNGKKFTLYPDFPTGGLVDVSQYNDGLRGGKVKVRVHIEEADKKTLLIKNVPYGITTSQLVDSILKANDNGKIKIKSVVDNTAKEVELNIQLAPGLSTDQTIDALYAFTDCEISISPNTCVIIEGRPHFITATELLRRSTESTKALLLQELEIRLEELEDDWHYSSLEKIFIEKRIYRDIEEEETWEGVLDAIRLGLKPYLKLLKRAVTDEDIIKLTEIRIKRISKFDAFKADEHIRGVAENITETAENIAQLNDYAIAYFQNLLKKYGKGKERKTIITEFEKVQAANVAIANVKLYANYKEGFIGTGLKKDELAFECSDLDQIIVFRRDGKMMVTKVADKTFVGRDILYLAVFQKNDERSTYNLIYTDGKTGITYAKRFNVTSITRDKEYDLTKGNDKSKLQYFSANANGEAEIVTIILSPGSKARIKNLDFSFDQIDIKARSAGGNQVTKYPIKQIKFKEKGKSTLAAAKLWYDPQFGRINKEEKGYLLGSFEPEDVLIVLYQDGNYEMADQDLLQKFDAATLVGIDKFRKNAPVSCIYFDKKSSSYYAKRFMVEKQTLRNKFLFIKEGEENYVLWASTKADPNIVIRYGKKKAELKDIDYYPEQEVELSGWKTVGTKLPFIEIKEVLEKSDEEDTDANEKAPTLF